MTKHWLMRRCVRKARIALHHRGQELIGVEASS